MSQANRLAASLVAGEIIVSPTEGELATLQVVQDSLDNKDVDADSNGEPQVETERWSLAGEDMEKTLWTHSALGDLHDNYSSDYEQLRKDVSTAEKDGSWKTIYDAMSSTAGGGSAKPIFKLFMDGVESYTLSRWVLRWSGVISTRAQGQFAHTNIGKQFTTQNMYDWEGLPADLSFAIPAGVWIKRTPTYDYEGTKINASMEYWHADTASTILYPTATDPTP